MSARTDYYQVQTRLDLTVTEETRVEVEPGLTIELYTVELVDWHVDWAGGRKSVYVSGRRIRRDGERGRHNRHAGWSNDGSRPLPDAIRSIVDDARPGWWTDDAKADEPALPPALPDGAELRFCIDANCPSCGWGERWFSPARQVFGCSKCSYTSTERTR